MNLSKLFYPATGRISPIPAVVKVKRGNNFPYYA